MNSDAKCRWGVIGLRAGRRDCDDEGNSRCETGRPPREFEYLAPINRSTVVWLGIIFVLVGALNVWLVVQASARVRDAKAGALSIAAHRIGGYLFITLFCVRGYFTVARLGDPGKVPPEGGPPASFRFLYFARRCD